MLPVNVIPAGNKSVSETLVAVIGPLLVTVMSKVTVSPSSGVGFPLASVFTVTRSVVLSMVTASIRSSPTMDGSI